MANTLLLKYVALVLFSVAPTPESAPDSSYYVSPDGAIGIHLRSVSGTCPESIMQVRRKRGDLLLTKKYISADCEHGFIMDRGQWSTDSRFFVYFISNSGGHQPWHYPILFYDRKRNRIFNLESTTGPICSPNFTLLPQARIRVSLCGLNERGELADFINLKPLVLNLAYQDRMNRATKLMR
jgi:hypothetical protein